MTQKTHIVIFLFLQTATLFGQIPDSLGLDNKSTLNGQETELLNKLLKATRDNFDFKDKKVAFASGNSGNSILTKQYYFNKCVKPWTKSGDTPQIFMVQLTQDEKLKSGGYDVIVLSWVKLFTDRQKKIIIKRLGDNKND